MKRIPLLAILLGAVLVVGCGGDSGITTQDPADPTNPSDPSDPGDPGDPTGSGISFEQDVFPTFAALDCVQCHSGGGIGMDLGGLMLDTAPNPVHRELTEEISPNRGTTRVDSATPAASLLLVMPSGEGGHPVFFQDTADPDYQTFLAWIAAGAPR